MVLTLDTDTDFGKYLILARNLDMDLEKYGDETPVRLARLKASYLTSINTLENNMLRNGKDRTFLMRHLREMTTQEFAKLESETRVRMVSVN
ncbi:MAG: hypothetical protein ABIH37_01730 [archaeon]